MEGLEGLQDLLLANLSKEEMVSALQFNGIEPTSLDISGNTVDMVCVISDGVAHGAAFNCPVCENPSLVECHGRLSCWGYMNGMTKCVFKASAGDCQRFNFRLPPALAEAPWLREWRLQWASSSSQDQAPCDDNDMATEDTPPMPCVNTEQTEAEIMTPAQLKKALKVRGLSQTGKKATLVKRLAAALTADKPPCEGTAAAAAEVPAAAPAPTPSADFFCDGLSLTAVKEGKSKTCSSSSSSSSSSSCSSSSSSAAAVTVEAVLPPQEGSSILEVHEGYNQTGSRHRAKILVAGTEVYK